jgi:hypothetical protein
MATHVRSQNFIPVLSIKGRNEVRLGGLHSLTGAPLAGPWKASAVEVGAAASRSPSPTSDEVDSMPSSSESPDEGSDTDLDSLLSSLSDDSDSSSDNGDSDTSGDSSNDDLDSLLASLGGDDDSESTNDDEMDADLAALLGDL